MKNFKFSVIIPIYNVEEYLEETLESIVNQSIGFEENIQLILINDGSIDTSEDICLSYQTLYPDNVIYYKQKNSGVSVARNKGIELASGEFINFLDSDDKWSKGAFEEVYSKYLLNPEIKLFSCKMRFFDAKRGAHPLNYKYNEDKIINILDDYEYSHLSSSSIFIKKEAIKNFRYDKNIKYAEDAKFINEIILDEQKMMMLRSPTYYYRKRQTSNSATNNQELDIDWYLTTPQQVFKYLFDLSKNKYGEVVKYIQYLVAFYVWWRVKINKKMILSNEEKEQYVNILTDLIKQMDEDVILNHKFNIFIKIFFLEVKYQKDLTSELQFCGDKVTFRNFSKSKKAFSFVILDQIYIRDNKIIFYGKLDKKFVPQTAFKVMSDNNKVKINYYELTNNYDEELFNDMTLHSYIGINFEMKIDESWNLRFYFKDEYLIPRFKKSSIFTEYLFRSYHHIGNRTIVFKKNVLCNQKRNLFKSIYYETRNNLNLLKRKRYKLSRTRIFAKIGNIFKRKEIWLISDRVNKANDNGEFFFKYMVKNHKEVKTYFILSKTSSDYERLSKIGKVLDPNSSKYKFIFNISDYVMSSNAEDYIFNPYGKDAQYVRGLWHFKFIFLQHGIIKDDLSSWLNVNTKKMDMFVTSTSDEYDSLLNCKYYYGSEVVKLTGLARYDSLLENSKKAKLENNIMLSLTWRNSLTNKIDKITRERLYSEDFIESDYFKFIDKLLNDKKLHKVLKNKNYKIRFIPHPNVICQLNDFTENEFVEIEKNINYQEEFCKNKLLITDYSSMFFDFGYLHKPVIYYQADREEFFEGQVYDVGYFDYEKMGFGPVIYNYDELINKIIDYINNDCKLEKKYKQRIDKTFKFYDNNNCERIYKEIKKLK